MSDEKKNKNSKQTFFRINSKGELTETEKTEIELPESEMEPLPTSVSPENMLQDSPTELGNKEPDPAPPSHEVTNSGLVNEPQAMQLELDSKDIEAPKVDTQEVVATKPSQILEASPSENGLDIYEEPSVTLQTPQSEEESLNPPDLNEPNKPEVPNDKSFETLRNYITLKEKEVSDLKEQQKQYQNVLIKLKRAQTELSHSNFLLQEELEASRANEQLIKKEIAHLREKHENEVAILKNDFDQQKVQSTTYQEQLQDLNRQKNIWKEKIAEDLKKIKIKEKELENRYELLKRDTETLLDSKDQQILELRKKIDAFELELESLEDRLRSEHAIINSIEGKKRRLIETLKLAISLLEQIDSSTDAQQERKTG